MDEEKKRANEKRNIYIYRVEKKYIFDHDFDHAPSPARGYNSVDFHFTPGQQISRGTAVFDKSSNRISSPAGTWTAPCSTFSGRFPEFSRASAISFFFFFFPFLFFFPFFFTWFRTHTKEATKEEVIRLTKGRHEVMVNLNIFFPFKSISATISFFHFERFYTSYSSNRYNKDRETQSIIFETNNIASKIKKRKNVSNSIVYHL